MAKKFVRGITDIKTINNQDFDTNNVNDLLSDGEHNYIHRKKKDKSEEYHNLTDNIKTISSDNTDLLEVTNNNKTTNSATLSPKHDAQKEQVLESTRDTIDITHGQNGTTDKTLVDVNASKVALLDNIHAGDNVSIDKSGNVLTISASGGDKPEYTLYDEPELVVIKEVFNDRVTFNFTLLNIQSEFILEGALKDDLLPFLVLPGYTNGVVTLSYDGHDAKIIVHTPSDIPGMMTTFAFTFFIN